MAPMAMDPALGMSGSLTAFGQPQVSTAPNQAPLASGDMSAAAADLSRAARGLETVQGNIAGQSMAIQQMSTQQQLSGANVSMLMNQLGTQISSLNQAVTQMTMAANMSSMGMRGAALPIAPPPPPMPVASPNWAAMAGGAGRMGMGGMALAAGAAGMAAGAGSWIGGRMAAPFMGTSVGAPMPGTLTPALGHGGAMTDLGLALGPGLSPSMMRMAHGGAIMQAGRERLAGGFGATAAGGIGAMGQLGAMGIGEYAGGMALRGLGFNTSGLLGSLAGGVVGMPVTAAAGAFVDEAMRQSAAITGMGDQYARNAFRFSSQGLGGSLRRPGYGERQSFGRGMNRMAIEDLTFSSGDMQEMFAGAVQGDLLRGTQSTQDVVRRMRELKETVKLVGRNLSMSVQEATGTLSDLQALGVNVSGPGAGRAAIFGASSVLGMTQREAFEGSMGIARNLAGQGLGGAGAVRMGGLAQGMTQSAVMGGMIDPAALAAVGGAGGASELFAGTMSQVMQGGLGRAMMMASMGRGGNVDISAIQGMSAQQIMGAAARNTTQQNLANIATNPQRYARQMMKNPAQFMATFMNVISGDVERFMGQGMDYDSALSTAASMHTGLQGPQLETFVAQMKNAPQALRQQATEQRRALSDAARSEVIENASITAKIGREWQRAARPVAELASGIGASVSSYIDNSLARGAERIYGYKDIAITRGGTEDMRALMGRGMADRGPSLRPVETGLGESVLSGLLGGGGAGLAKEQQRRKALIENTVKAADAVTSGDKSAANRIFSRGSGKNQGQIKKLVNDLKTSKDPAEKREIAQKIAQLASDGLWEDGMNDPSNPMHMRMRAAMREQIFNAYGVDVENPQDSRDIDTGLTKAEIDEADRVTRRMADKMEVDFTAMRQAVDSGAVAKAVEASQSGDKAAMDAARADLEKVFGKDSEVVDRFFQDNFLEQAGVSKAELGSTTNVSRLQAAGARVKAAGESASRILEEAGVGFDTVRALRERGTAKGVIQALGAMKLGKTEMDKLRGVEGGEALLAAISADVGGSDVDVGLARADMLTSAMVGGTSTTGSRGSTVTDTAALSKNLVDLTLIIERLQARQALLEGKKIDTP